MERKICEKSHWVRAVFVLSSWKHCNAVNIDWNVTMIRRCRIHFKYKCVFLCDENNIYIYSNSWTHYEGDHLGAHYWLLRGSIKWDIRNGYIRKIWIYFYFHVFLYAYDLSIVNEKNSPLSFIIYCDLCTPSNFIIIFLIIFLLCSITSHKKLPKINGEQFS